MKRLFISLYLAVALIVACSIPAIAATGTDTASGGKVVLDRTTVSTEPGSPKSWKAPRATSTTEPNKTQHNNSGVSTTSSDRTGAEVAPVKTKKHASNTTSSSTTSTDVYAPVKKSAVTSTSTTLKQRVVVEGEKIKNPALLTKTKKTKLNKAEIDFKPFLAMAILLIIAGRTSFERTSSPSWRRENKINKRTGIL